MIPVLARNPRKRVLIVGPMGRCYTTWARGGKAFPGATSAIIFHAILERAPTSPTRLNPELPLKLEEIINKALKKDHKLRYQTAADLRADLQSLKRDTDSARVLTSLRLTSLRAGLRARIALSANGDQRHLLQVRIMPLRIGF